MLSKNNPIQRDQLGMVALDQMVPQELFVRKLEAALDFYFIEKSLKRLSFFLYAKEFGQRLHFV